MQHFSDGGAANWPFTKRRDLIMRGLGVKPGDPVPGRWAGEVDMIYEPAAWDVLVRSPEATTSAIFGLFRGGPAHRIASR